MEGGLLFCCLFGETKPNEFSLRGVDVRECCPLSGNGICEGSRHTVSWSPIYLLGEGSPKVSSQLRLTLAPH